MRARRSSAPMPVSWPCARRAERTSRSCSSIPATSSSTPPRLPAPLDRLSARAAKSGRTVFANDLARGSSSASPRDPVIVRFWTARCSRRSSSPATWLGSSAWSTSPGASLRPTPGSPRSLPRWLPWRCSGAAPSTASRRTAHALEREVREGATHLRQAEEMFKTLVENLPDIIARFDPDLRHLYVSPAVRASPAADPGTSWARRTRSWECRPS